MGISLARQHRRYLLLSALLVLAYLATVLALWLARGWTDQGRLSFHAPALRTSLPGAVSLSKASHACEATSALDARNSYQHLKIVGGEIHDSPYYACYGVKADGSVSGAAVLSGADLTQVTNVDLIKAGGAWPWIGVVKNVADLVLGAVAMPAIAGVYYLYYRRARPGPPTGPWWTGRWADLCLGVAAIIGWIALWALPGRSRARKVRISFEIMFGCIAVTVFTIDTSVLRALDLLSAAVVGLLTVMLLWGWLGGRTFVRASDWAASADAVAAAPWAVQGYGTGSDRPAPRHGSASTARPPVSAEPEFQPRQEQSGKSSPAEGESFFRVVPPDQLPTFANVGGMAKVKQKITEAVGTVLAYGPEANAYGLRFNGLLLYGQPGTGKTFIAKATAGEYGMNFIHVSTGDLVSKYVGESAQNIDGAFQVAAAHVPCLLFFDEFDSIAQRREDEPSVENRRTVNQLLTSLEQWRDNRDLFVVAATNDLDALDLAVIRPGRFDRKIRVDLPDQLARVAILRAQLTNRPTAGPMDLDKVAQRAEGLTPAAIASVVQDAALMAFRASTQAGTQVPITTEHLMTALAARGGQDRPAVNAHGWDELILDERTLAELRQLQRLIEDPERARRMGVDPPAGLLLTGPPGTGKTTVAKILAAQTKCSFYPQSAADLTSKWVGDSEKNIRKLFDRARDNTPSIVFLDEIDSIAAQRASGLGGAAAHDQMLTQLLTEIDGVSDDPRRVFVVGATNRPEILDPALTRGGRLSRTINIPLPDQEQRYSLLVLHARRMPLAAGIDLHAIAARTGGFSGGDIQALTQQAAVHAMMRDEQAAQVTQMDFLSAIDAEHTLSRPRSEPTWPTETRTSITFTDSPPTSAVDRDNIEEL